MLLGVLVLPVSASTAKPACPKATFLFFTELQECAAFFSLALEEANLSKGKEDVAKRLSQLLLDTIDMSAIPGDQLNISRADQKAGIERAAERLIEAVEAGGDAALDGYENCEFLHNTVWKPRLRELSAQHCPAEGN